MFTDLVQQLTTNFVVGGLAAFALALGFFAIHYLNQRRKLLHQERMATLVKGLHYAGVARDVLVQPKPDERDHLLCGMRWLFGATAASGAMYGYESLQPVADAGAAMQGALVGLIPAAIGLAHLLFSWLSGRRRKKATAAALAPGTYYRVAYRPAVRR
jgi:hypothetical protein